MALFRQSHFDQVEFGDLHKEVDVSKHDLNVLVLDYLLIEGFLNGAIEFARETGIPADIDHAKVSERMEIRQWVEDGKVVEAIERVNDIDVEILDTNAPLLFHLLLLRFIELIREEQLDTALEFATHQLAPRGAENPQFLSELEKTMALLAFPDLARYADDSLTSRPKPELSAETLALFDEPAFDPIMALMKRSQRVKVARELNQALLEYQGCGMETKLSCLVKLMAWGEEKLVDGCGVVLPEEERRKGRAWAETVLAGELEPET